MPNVDNQTVMLAIAAVTAIAVLMQAFVLLAILFAVRKATRSMKERVEELQSMVMPVLHNTRDLITRVTPYVESTLYDVATMAREVHDQSAHVEAAGKEILENLRKQSTRVDRMLTGVLDAVDHAGSFLTDAVSKPARQFAGILASLKAVVESLRSSGEGYRHSPNGDSGDFRPPIDEDQLF